MVPEVRAKLEPHFQAHVHNMKHWILPLLKEENPNQFPYKIDPKGCGKFSGTGVWTPAAFHEKPVDLPARADHLAQYILNIAYCPPVATEEPDYTRLKDMVKMLAEESFGEHAVVSKAEARKRVLPLFVINRYRSLDPVRNNRFWNYLGRIEPFEGIPFRAVGNFWNLRWIKEKNQCTYSVYQAWRVVHAANPVFAERVRATVEEGVADQIPWQKIRQFALESPVFEQAAKEMRQKAPNSPLYLMTMDGDFKRIKTGNVGLFSQYDRMIRQSPFLPDVMSTGYCAPDDAGDFLKMGIQMDQAVRSAMASVIPFAPYYPEPNSGLRLQPGGVYSYKGAGKNMETRRLMQNAVNKGLINTGRGIYANHLGPVATTIPIRMDKVMARKWQAITKKDIGKKEVLKGFCSVNQSHVNLKQWGDILYVALPVKSEVHLASVQLQRIYKCFHPIYLVQGWSDTKAGKYSVNHFREFMRLYPDYAGNFVAGNPAPFVGKGGTRVFFDARQRELSEALTELQRLGLNQEWRNKVVEAARLSGDAIYRVLAEKNGA